MTQFVPMHGASKQAVGLVPFRWPNYLHGRSMLCLQNSENSHFW